MRLPSSEHRPSADIDQDIAPRLVHQGPIGLSDSHRVHYQGRLHSKGTFTGGA
jgi:hypothetical protein